MAQIIDIMQLVATYIVYAKGSSLISCGNIDNLVELDLILVI